MESSNLNPTYLKFSSWSWENRKAEILFLLALLIFFSLGVFLRLKALDAAVINDWVTRDFNRAFNILDGTYLPLAGQELTNGGRLPGPFLYMLLALPILFHYSYEVLFNFNFILNIASIIILFFVLRKYFDVYIAIISTALLSVNLYHIGAVNFPMNPSFLFLFVVLFLLVLFEFSLKKNLNASILIVLILSLGGSNSLPIFNLYCNPRFYRPDFQNKNTA